MGAGNSLEVASSMSLAKEHPNPLQGICPLAINNNNHDCRRFVDSINQDGNKDVSRRDGRTDGLTDKLINENKYGFYSNLYG